MAMISHGCAHCGGDLFAEMDERGGTELRCLQCGRTPTSATSGRLAIQERCPNCGLWPRVGSMRLHIAVCGRKGLPSKGDDIVVSERGAAYKAAYLKEKVG